ncbi:MAG: hypothetical protein AVDCRST_MAG22-2418, partial [uncultured Rubrobacteraceae bacterium]
GLGSSGPGEQGALRPLRLARGLRDGRVRVGDAPPRPGQLRAVLRVLLGVGALRHRRAPGDGRVQDEPPAQAPGAGAPHYTPVHRRVAHRHPGLEHGPLRAL